MNYVYSTLTCGNNFAVYAPNDSKDLPVIEREIVINGGHGVASKSLFTPKGVVTEVSDADLKLLMENVHFQNHIKTGHIQVERVRSAPEKVANDMNPKDGSSPLTPSDYEPSSDGTKNSYKPKAKK